MPSASGWSWSIGLGSFRLGPIRAGNVRSASSIEKRIKAIGEERPLHTDEAVIGPARLLVEALLPQLRVLSEGISCFEAEIAEVAPRQPD